MMPFSECHDRSPMVMSLFYPALIAAATIIFAGPTVAQTPGNREASCQPAPDDCAPLHICLSDGRLVEGYTTPGYRGRTWLGDISTGGGCLGQLNEEGPSGLICMDLERRDTDDFLMTLTEAADGTLTGHGTLPNGISFDVFGSSDPAATIPAECVVPSS